MRGLRSLSARLIFAHGRCFQYGGMKMDYEYYYNNARNRYYNACSEINSCQNRLNDLRVQQQNVINRINQLKAEIRDHENAYEQMVQVVRHEDALNSKFSAVISKTDDASANFAHKIFPLFDCLGYLFSTKRCTSAIMASVTFNTGNCSGSKPALIAKTAC